MSSPSSPSGLADGPSEDVNRLVAETALIDHHVHSIVRGRLSATEIVDLACESSRPGSARAAGLDTQVGFAIRRWCAPLLGLPASVAADGYLAERTGLDNEAVAGLLLPATGVEHLLVDTGFNTDRLLPLDALGRLAQARVSEIVRLEALAEQVALGGTTALGFAAAFREQLETRAAGAVGLKSIIAYRHGGLDFDPDAPSAPEVAERAGAWLREVEATSRARLSDPVLLRFVLWEGARTGLPLQIHAGFGDTDLELHRADPVRMTAFLKATEELCPILLLHNYPFHRQAGYLAQMFRHVHLDVGLAVSYVGAQSTSVVAEALELAPFTKVLYSSDAWGLPELHLVGSWLFRRALARVVGGWVAAGDWSADDARRVVGLVCAENARRVYRLA